jgi:hypothetical protein
VAANINNRNGAENNVGVFGWKRNEIMKMKGNNRRIGENVRRKAERRENNEDIEINGESMKEKRLKKPGKLLAAPRQRQAKSAERLAKWRGGQRWQRK